MEQVIGVLMRIRDELDALIVGLSAQPEPETIALRETPDPKTCKHKNKQTFQGAGGAAERTVCTDCGKEF
jgi:hypothetical protein